MYLLACQSAIQVSLVVSLVIRVTSVERCYYPLLADSKKTRKKLPSSAVCISEHQDAGLCTMYFIPHVLQCNTVLMPSSINKYKRFTFRFVSYVKHATGIAVKTSRKPSPPSPSGSLVKTQRFDPFCVCVWVWGVCL